MQVQELMAQLDVKKTQEEVWALAIDFFKSHGIKFVMYVYCRGYKNTKEDTLFFSNMPKAWGELYERKHYVEIDPFFTYCCDHYEPLKMGYEYIDGYGFLTDDERKFIIEAKNMTGFSAGTSITMRRKGLGPDFGGWNIGTSLTKEQFDLLYEKKSNILRLAATYIHERLTIVLKKDVAETQFYIEQPLTKKQIECLTLLSKGLRTQQIADKMKIKTVTVDHHLKHIKERLKARTREQAIARAIIKGLI